MTRHIVTFERFDVIRVPFPFTDQLATKNRPALILSSAEAFQAETGHSVMAMITSARHRPWALDVELTALDAVGLSSPSRVRFKLFTLDHRLVRGRLGRLSAGDAAQVEAALRRLLSFGA